MTYVALDNLNSLLSDPQFPYLRVEDFTRFLGTLQCWPSKRKSSMMHEGFMITPEKVLLCKHVGFPTCPLWSVRATKLGEGKPKTHDGEKLDWGVKGKRLLLSTYLWTIPLSASNQRHDTSASPWTQSLAEKGTLAVAQVRFSQKRPVTNKQGGKTQGNWRLF